MQLSEKKPSKLLSLNLTSLIDVLFILIIFFAVSSTFVEQPGIQLKLPEARTSQEYTTQKVILYIDKEKHIFLNDQLITMDSMIGEIQKLGKLSKENNVVLKADNLVDHGTVVKVMDLLRQNGIYKIIISTALPE